MYTLTPPKKFPRNRLNGDANLKSLPVVLMTASVDRLTPENLTALGVQAFLLKPFEAKSLYETVAKLVGPAT